MDYNGVGNRKMTSDAIKPDTNTHTHTHTQTKLNTEEIFL